MPLTGHRTEEVVGIHGKNCNRLCRNLRQRKLSCRNRYAACLASHADKGFRYNSAIPAGKIEAVHRGTCYKIIYLASLCIHLAGHRSANRNTGSIMGQGNILRVVCLSFTIVNRHACFKVRCVGDQWHYRFGYIHRLFNYKL